MIQSITTTMVRDRFTLLNNGIFNFKFTRSEKVYTQSCFPELLQYCRQSMEAWKIWMLSLYHWVFKNLETYLRVLGRKQGANSDSPSHTSILVCYYISMRSGRRQNRSYLKHLL